MKKTGRENKVAVVVGTVTNDVRLYDVPNLKVIYFSNQNLISWWTIICGYGIDINDISK